MRQTTDSRRLGEIMGVLRRNGLTGGITPDKLCAILEELGPTFIKLGQILSMRSDVLPAPYCEALTRLRANVSPMPFSEVTAIVERAYGRPLSEVFSAFEEKPLGSASIAQAHAAALLSGERVVVKVQREGIREIMSQDITLLKKAAGLLKYTPVKGLVDFNQVLEEMWTVAQQEMSFLTEAANLERFSRLNAEVAFVTAPKLYRAQTTEQVLVMEYIAGCAIDDQAALTAAGYDLREIGQKLADNYVRQITVDGFFHADPHPGNLRVRDGQIVFLDMGMMGTLSEGERKTISRAVAAIARQDADACAEAVMRLGQFSAEPDRARLRQRCETMLSRYAAMDLGSMDLSRVFADMMDIMRENGIAMPAGLTMLARGLATVEGVVKDIAPDISVAQVAAARVSRNMLADFDLRDALTRDGRAIYESATKALDIPALAADLLRTGLKGEAGLSLSLRPAPEARALASNLVSRLCAALLAACCLLGAALERVEPRILLGMSWLGLVCLAGLGAALAWLIALCVKKK